MDVPPHPFFERAPFEGRYVPAQVTHRRADLWPQPERFDPDRFLPEREAARHKFAYYPFGAGTRLCIGQAFANMELRLVLATVLQRCG